MSSLKGFPLVFPLVNNTKDFKKENIRVVTNMVY